MTVIRYIVLSSIVFLVIVIGQTEVLCLAGENVVLKAIEAVEKADLFESDYGFLKRWAYVETQFGQLSGFLGGLWRIDNQQLKDTQMEAQNINGSVWREKINQAFGINWVNVELKDLEKPLVSCLAARILLLMTRSPPPVLLVDQASVYKTLKAKENKSPSNAYSDFIAKVTEYEVIKALESVRSDHPIGQQRSGDTCDVFTLKTGGKSATSNFVPGIYDTNGKFLVQFSHGYNIITMENGSFFAKQFYIWDGNNMKEMATYLESLPMGKSIIVASWDDGARNRDQNGIPDLMYNIGASKGIFGGTMLFRSMYVLFGRRGLGEGKGKEFYSGKIDQDPNAFVTPSFYVSNDVIISETALETGTYHEDDPCLATRIKHVAGLNLTSALDQAFLWRQSKQVSNAMNIFKSNVYSDVVKAIAGAEASKVQKENPEVVTPPQKKKRFFVNLTCDCPKSSDEVFSLYTLKTNGLSAKVNFLPGVYDANGKQVVKLLQGVNVITVVKGAFVAKAFYIFNSNYADDLAKYLESIPKGKTVIVATMDDGKDNRMSSGIPELMYDMGASIGLFGENMKYRSVYVLVGQRGIGQGKGKEYYRGETDHNVNSWLKADFYVKNDTIFSDNAYQLVKSHENGIKTCSNIKEVLYCDSSSVTNVVNSVQQNKLSVDAEYKSTGKVQHESLFEMYKIKTAGRSAKPPFNVMLDSGIYDSEDRKVIGFKQGYNIITLDNGQFVRKTFFAWNRETQEMATYLKTIPNGKTVIIATMDEAKENRFANGTADLIYDIGGSKAIFGGDMKYRSVYVLIGQKGAGTGKGKEYYRGATDYDSNAWLTTEFFVSGDQIFSENGVAEVLLQTIKFLGNNAKQYPSSKDVYELSKSKPFEVEDMQETLKRNWFNLKASFYF